VRFLVPFGRPRHNFAVCGRSRPVMSASPPTARCLPWCPAWLRSIHASIGTTLAACVFSSARSAFLRRRRRRYFTVRFPIMLAMKREAPRAREDWIVSWSRSLGRVLAPGPSGSAISQRCVVCGGFWPGARPFGGRAARPLWRAFSSLPALLQPAACGPARPRMRGRPPLRPASEEVTILLKCQRYSGVLSPAGLR